MHMTYSPSPRFFLLPQPYSHRPGPSPTQDSSPDNLRIPWMNILHSSMQASLKHGLLTWAFPAYLETVSPPVTVAHVSRQMPCTENARDPILTPSSI